MNVDRENKKIKTITLIITERCNLNCSYCFEHFKSARQMTFDVAKTIIDQQITDCLEYDELIIEFFGGEPFLNFDLIKQVSHYVDSLRLPIRHTLFATTNGTLIHGEIKEWLVNKPNFICCLSIDGNKAMQDINRDNSFDTIDIGFFSKHYSRQAIKMTISQETLCDLAEGVIFLHKCGFLVNCNLAFSIDWSKDTNKEILSTQLSKLIDFYLANPTIPPCSMFGWSISAIGYDDSSTIRKWCGAGTNMFTFDVDGNCYPCQFFAPQSIGEKLSNQAKTLKFKKDIEKSILDPKCRSCIFVSACPTCFGSNYATTGNMYQKDENICELTKIILKARSYFQALLWESGRLTFSSREEQLFLRAVLKIQNN